MAPKLVKVSKVALRNNNDKGFDVTADQVVVDKSSASGNGVGLRTVTVEMRADRTRAAASDTILLAPPPPT